MTERDTAVSAPAITPPSPVRYATLTSRFRALVIDVACIWALLIVLFFIGDAARGIPGAPHLTWLVMVAVFLLYDPVQVSRRGATIGHLAAKLRVVDARTGGWPSFARSFARSLVKSILGVVSFFPMELSRRHQAVHDVLTRTTVQVAESAEHVDFRVERVDEPDVVLPSRFRRVAVIVLYLIVVYLALGVSVALAGATTCARAGACGTGTRVLLQIIGLGWLALSATVIITGWKGFLPGARRARSL